MSKWKLNPCPTCDGEKSKAAVTCMTCFRSGKGKTKAYGKSPRNDVELRKRLRIRVDQIKEELNHGNI